MKSNCSTVMKAPAAWELIVDGPRSGEENMARDRDLLDLQRNPSARPVVRFYRWTEPTLTYGRLQDRASAEALSDALGGRAVVQRPTGGGMVLHDSDLSFSVVWRRDHPAFPPCIKNVYRLLHETLAEGLRSRGVNVDLHQVEGSKRRAPGVCYREFSQDDLIWRGEKVVGGALRVTSWGRLYQGNFKALSPFPTEGWEREFANAFGTRLFLCPPTPAV